MPRPSGAARSSPPSGRPERLRQVRFGRADVDDGLARHRRVEGHAQHAREAHDERQLHQRQFDRQRIDQRVLREHAAAERRHQPQHGGERPAFGPDDHARRAERERAEQVRERLVEQPAEELTGLCLHRQNRSQHRRQHQHGDRPSTMAACDGEPGCDCWCRCWGAWGPMSPASVQWLSQLPRVTRKQTETLDLRAAPSIRPVDQPVPVRGTDLTVVRGRTRANATQTRTWRSRASP